MGEKQFADSLIRVCRRVVHRATTLYDELLNLEFLLGPAEHSDFSDRLKQLPERLFSDMYLLFGPTPVDGDFEQAIAALFDSTLGFQTAMRNALEQMSAWSSQPGESSSPQGQISSGLRRDIQKLLDLLKLHANDVIRLGSTFVGKLVSPHNHGKANG